MIKAAIIGGSGYTGAELVRLLANHPEVEITTVTSETYAGKMISDLYPNLIGQVENVFVHFDGKTVANDVDLVFVALPHGQPMDVVPGLLKTGVKVIDLSGDFRLADSKTYLDWYKKEHTAPDLLASAAYGLPELFDKSIVSSRLVANPGCYPTSVILGTAPLLKASLIFAQDIIVDSLTGVSGSGRAASVATHFCFCDENVSTYKAGGVHQHISEMELYMGQAADEEVKISFTPHLASFSRGIYSTIYADLKEDLGPEEILSCLQKFYEKSYFVKVLGEGRLPEVKAVAGSNYCHIGAAVDERCGRVVIVSAIDNLGKGAAGQAIQNMNIMSGLPEETGLQAIGLYP